MNPYIPILPNVQETVQHLPAQPGVYLMKDARGTIMYIGKAKVLRNRVRSYFSPHLPSLRIATMVLQIAEIEYIVTHSEIEALILEATLIKKHKPHYNVVLKDDKSFPYIKITLNEAFPRILSVRKVRKDGALYFGPYVNVKAMNSTLHLLKRHFPLRLCSGDVTFDSKTRPCFEYEIRRCPGVCAGKCGKEEYWQTVEEAKLFLQGKKDALLTDLQTRMEQYAEALEFERAATLRDQIDAVKKVMERQKIVSPGLENQDVLAIARKGTKLNVQIFFIRNGALMGRKAFGFSERVETEGGDERTEPLDESEVLQSVVEQFYVKDVLIPDEILLSHDIPNQAMIAEWLSEKKGKKVSLLVPQRGKKRELIAMVQQNAELAMIDAPEPDAAAMLPLLERLKDLFQLKNLPRRIECFDISNIQGTMAVGSMVVCVDGKMQPRAYKRYKIKTIEGSDDFGMMQEVVTRRYSRVQKEGLTFPDLIMVDGGKGQLHAAQYALYVLGVSGADVVGIAKSHGVRGSETDIERIFTTITGDGIVLDTTTKSAQLLQHIRDEAHRFAITYHRQLRKKANFHSMLEEIPGVGKKRRKLLLTRFGSLKRLKEATIDELADTPSIHRELAEIIYTFLHADNAAAMAASNGSSPLENSEELS